MTLTTFEQLETLAAVWVMALPRGWTSPAA